MCACATQSTAVLYTGTLGGSAQFEAVVAGAAPDAVRGWPADPEAGARVRTKAWDHVYGAALDEAWADAPASYILTSATAGGAFAADGKSGGAAPVAVARKTMQNARGYCGAYDAGSGVPGGSGVGLIPCWTATHTVTLDFAAAIPIGHVFELRFLGGAGAGAGTGGGGTLAGQALRIDLRHAAAAHSPAVHVNQLGFIPSQIGHAHAYVSFWRGDAAGSVKLEPAERRWRVAVAATLETAAVGNAPAMERATESTPDNDRGANFAKAFVYDVALAASTGDLPLDTDLVVVVDGIGASRPFRIAQDVYATALAASLRVFYYQRNGVALDTTWEGVRFKRGATFDRAADGTTTLQHAGVALEETGNADFYPGGILPGAPDLGWSALNATARMGTADVCAAPRGWQDAGDWDTRAPHLEAACYLMVLVERFPGLYGTLELGVPGESGNGVPDLLEQALWLVDSYRMGQRADGGVSGGFETLSHPHFGDTSTHQSQPYFCYAPGRFSTLHYAEAAAQAARLLGPFDTARAAGMAESARRAYSWSEANAAVPAAVLAAGGEATKRYTAQISDLRGRCALQLLLLDGPSATLQDVVREEEHCTTGGLVGSHTENGLLFAWHAGRAGTAAVLGSSLASTLQPACRSAVAAVAGYVARGIAATSYRLPLAFMPETSVSASPLAMYRVLDADLAAGAAHGGAGGGEGGGRPALPSPAYLGDLAALLDFGFGANPLSRVYMTDGGVDCLLGSNAVRAPLRVDSLYVSALASSRIKRWGVTYLIPCVLICVYAPCGACVQTSKRNRPDRH